MEENDETALTLNNVDSKQKEDQDVLSAEDLAWVNSCLIEDPDSNIDSLKEALLNILDHHSEIFPPSDNSNDVTAPENSPVVMEEATESTDTGGQSGHSDDEGSEVLVSPIKYPFNPNFNDEMMKVEYSDSKSDSDSDSDDGLVFRVSELVKEAESEGIFKVWELEIPVEEDELVKELKEALSENGGGSSKVPKVKGVKIESLDSLVDSIADLSLK